MSIINMHPPKKLLFATIELDITPEDAILELIDTFIEWYRYYRIRDKVQGKGNIEIHITEESFIIESNYPGPPKNMAPKMLRFGEKVDKGCIDSGGYGIGTKRAIFKIGQDICLESDDDYEYYLIHISKEWIENEEDWNLPWEQKDSQGNPLDKISITSLYPSISAKFKSKAFIIELIQKVRDTYASFIEKDVDIKICGEPVKPYEFKFIFKEDKEYQIKPYHRKFILDGVSAEIFAGFTKWKENDPYGWYAFCNDRLIIRNDSSNRIGFEPIENIIYKPEDNIFLGLVFFRSYLFDLEKTHSEHLSKGNVKEKLKKAFLVNGISLSKKAVCKTIDSKHWQIKDSNIIYKIEELGEHIHIYTDPINLPWKSSKDDIRKDSRIYSLVQDEIRAVTATFIKYIRFCEKESKDRGADIIKSLLESVNDIKDIKKRCEIKVEDDEFLPPQEWVKKCYDINIGLPKLTSIKFWKSVELVKSVKERLGNVNMSNEEMAEAILSYYLKREDMKNEQAGA